MRHRLAPTARAAMGYTPPAVPGTSSFGTWPLERDQRMQAIATSREARYGRLTYGAGPVPARFSTYPATGLTPERVYRILSEADLTGICLHKADLTLQILRRDSHITGTFHTVRTRVSSAHWRFRPYDPSDLAKALARYCRSWWDNVDALDRALYSLLIAPADGYGVGEVVDKWTPVRFQGPGGNWVTVRGDHPRQIGWVHNKHVRFDPQTDAPTFDIGGGRYIDQPRGKIIFHHVAGDTLTESRGWIQSVSYLHCISHNAVARWAIFLAQFGLPTVSYRVSRQHFTDPQRRREYEEIVQRLGDGIGSVCTDEGDLDVKPAPAGGTTQGIHAALIGWSNNEKSKAIQGEQLTTEVGGNGAGYNTSETQAQVQDAWIHGYAKSLAEDLREDLVAPTIEKNLDGLTVALGASADEIMAVVPRLIAHTQRPLSPAVMVQVLGSAKNELGLDVAAEEARELLGLTPPRDGDELPGRTQVVGKDAALIPTSAAQTKTDGVQNTAPDTEAEARATHAQVNSAPTGMSATDRADPGVMVALYPRPEVAQALALQGGEDPEELHITLAYLGRRSKVSGLAGPLPAALRALAPRLPSLSGTLGGIGMFPPSPSSEGRAVAWVPVDVPGLAELRQEVVELLAQLGQPARADHGWVPHLTLAYLPPGSPPPAPVDARPVTFTDLVLVCGKERVAFRLGPPAASAPAAFGSWEEGKHPRAQDGKFGSGSGSGSGSGGGESGGAAEGWQPPREGPPPLRDADHAHEWLKEHYPHLDASLHGMHKDLIQGHVEQLHGLSQKYPEVAGAMKGLHVVPVDRFKKPDIGGQTDTKTGKIELNAGVFGDADRLRRLDDTAVQSGLFPKGSASPQGMFTHEFGHLVHGQIAEQTDPSALRKWRAANLAQGLASDYAAHSIGESFAESFRQMHHAPEKDWAPATRRLADFLGKRGWLALRPGQR